MPNKRLKIFNRIVSVCLCVLLLGSLCVTGCNSKSSSKGSSSAVAQIAKEELDGYANNQGEKFWSFMGFSSRVDWCACFASYCADQAGLIESGNAPKSAAVSGWTSFYREAGDKGSLEDAKTYTPVAGDFIIWDGQHIAVVYSYDADTNKVTCIEGNYGDAMACTSYDANSSGADYYAHPASSGSKKSSSYGCSSSSSTSGTGTTINIPDGLGTVCSYMGWQCITATTSTQYKLREESGEHYDSDGFAKIGDRYVVACTTTYGNIGDYVDFTFANGEVIHTVMGDAKNFGDEGCNKYGHLNGDCIIEFVVDKSVWYDGTHPGNPTYGYHEEWRGQAVTKAVNCGNYFNGDSAKVSGSSGSSFFTSCTSKNTGGSAQKLEDATENQKKIVDASMTTQGIGNMCLQFVNDVYENAGFGFDRLQSAQEAYDTYCTSSNMNELKVGMLVAVASAPGNVGSVYGHVGIYIGDDQIRECISTGAGTTTDLNEWLEHYQSNGSSAKWGFPPVGLP